MVWVGGNHSGGSAHHTRAALHSAAKPRTSARINGSLNQYKQQPETRTRRQQQNTTTMIKWQFAAPHAGQTQPITAGHRHDHACHNTPRRRMNSTTTSGTRHGSETCGAHHTRNNNTSAAPHNQPLDTNNITRILQYISWRMTPTTTQHKSQLILSMQQHRAAPGRDESNRPVRNRNVQTTYHLALG